jgi:hypothetical protein
VGGGDWSLVSASVIIWGSVACDINSRLWILLVIPLGLLYIILSFCLWASLERFGFRRVFFDLGYLILNLTFFVDTSLFSAPCFLRIEGGFKGLKVD